MRLTARHRPRTVCGMTVGPRRSRLGVFIRKRRKELKMTRQHLVKLSKVSKRALAALESGEAIDPRSSTVIALAYALETSTDELLGLTG